MSSISGFLGARVPVDELVALHELAERRGTSLSAETREALTAHLAANDGEHEPPNDKRAGMATQRAVPAPACGAPDRDSA